MKIGLPRSLNDCRQSRGHFPPVRLLCYGVNFRMDAEEFIGSHFIGACLSRMRWIFFIGIVLRLLISKLNALIISPKTTA